MRPDELAEVTGLRVPDDGPYETLGGLVMAELGRVPAVGDEVLVDGVQLHVEQMAGRRVERLRVRTADRTDADTPDGTGASPDGADTGPAPDARRDGGAA